MSTDLEFITQTLGNEYHIMIEKKLSLASLRNSVQAVESQNFSGPWRAL